MWWNPIKKNVQVVWFEIRQLNAIHCVNIWFVFSYIFFFHSFRSMFVGTLIYLFVHVVLLINFVYFIYIFYCVFVYLSFYSKRSIECTTLQTCTTTSCTRTSISPSKSLAKTELHEEDANKNRQLWFGTDENVATTSVLIVESGTGTNSTTTTATTTTTTKTTTVTVTVASLQTPTRQRQTSSFFTSKFMFLFSAQTHTHTHKQLT